MNFRARLAKVLGEDQYAMDTPVPSNALTAVQELGQQLEEAQRNIQDLEDRYNQALYNLYGQVATEIGQGGVGFGLNDGGACSFRHQDHEMVTKPCFKSKSWIVNSSDGRQVGPVEMGEDYGSLVQALSQLLGGL